MRYIGIILVNLAILTACVSDSARNQAEQDETVTVRTVKDFPFWFSYPPSEKGYIYGIGTDENKEKAKSKSIVNAGQQFSSRVNTVLVDKAKTVQGDMVASLYKIDQTLTSGVVKGAKYYDQFQDSRDFTALLMDEVEREVLQTRSDYLGEIQISRTVSLSPAVISVDGRSLYMRLDVADGRLSANNLAMVVQLKTADNDDSRYGIIISSDVTQEHEGYGGNYAGGTITLYYYDTERIMGSFDLTTNHEEVRLEGVFNIKL